MGLDLGRFMSSVGGATFVIAVTGFSWAVTVWAPFSLVSIFHFIHSWIVRLYTSAYQLAEVILSEPAARNFEEIGSIRLADTRSRAREEEEQQFLVSEEEEADSDDGKSRSSSPDHGEETRLGTGRNSVMGNVEAQMSIVDVHASNGDMHRISEENVADPDVERDAGVGESNDNGLAAKAGIILVGDLYCFQYSLTFLMHYGVIGHPQYLCCHTTVYSNDYVIHHLRNFGP